MWRVRAVLCCAVQATMWPQPPTPQSRQQVATATESQREKRGAPAPSSARSPTPPSPAPAPRAAQFPHPSPPLLPPAPSPTAPTTTPTPLTTPQPTPETLSHDRQDKHNKRRRSLLRPGQTGQQLVHGQLRATVQRHQEALQQRLQANNSPTCVRGVPPFFVYVFLQIVLPSLSFLVFTSPTAIRPLKAMRQ